MCSICGIIHFDGMPVDQELLSTMSDRMALRGPDHGGIFASGNIGLAHRRLSIIDLETGNQPMAIDGGNIVISYNGEVYNFNDIREDLKIEGAIFRTKSDTEVVAMAYQYYGIEKCLEKLEGMFAFAIYDKRAGKVVLARDRFGEKPIYYYQDNDSFYFASELKALAPSLKKFKLDKNALNLFLTILYIPAPYTIYQEVRKLEPGHYMEIHNGGEITMHQYYDVSHIGLECYDDYETAKLKLRSYIEDAVKSRMISDVPMGAFLSGGIDSSIICAIMSKLSNSPVNTYSIGFEEIDYDESDRAQLMARHIGANHTQFTLHYDDVLNDLDNIILYYDEPYGGSSAIPSYYVAKLAGKGVKVVLTGDCADELLGGYEKYLAGYYGQKYKKIPLLLRKGFEFAINLIPINSITNNSLRKIKKVIRFSQCSGFELYYNLLSNGFDDQHRKRLLKDSMFVDIKYFYQNLYQQIEIDCTELQRQQLMDVKKVLEGQMFVKVDRACMHNSLENRTPFIDRRVAEYALSMADEYKIKGRDKKRILKDAFKDILPAEILKFSKRGFGVPVDHWFRNELKDELLKLCSKDFIDKQGLFNYDYIQEIIDEHIKGKENHKNMLWNLFVFQKWYKKNIQ